MDKDGYHGYDKPSMKVEGPLHVVCQCDKCKTESQEPVGWIDSKGNMLCAKINESCRPLYTYPPQRTEPEPVQVSPLEFVEMVMEKEDLIGKPIFWAEWPNKEKNSA